VPVDLYGTKYKAEILSKEGGLCWRHNYARRCTRPKLVQISTKNIFAGYSRDNPANSWDKELRIFGLLVRKFFSRGKKQAFVPAVGNHPSREPQVELTVLKKGL